MGLDSGSSSDEDERVIDASAEQRPSEGRRAAAAAGRSARGASRETTAEAETRAGAGQSLARRSGTRHAASQQAGTRGRGGRAGNTRGRGRGRHLQPEAEEEEAVQADDAEAKEYPKPPPATADVAPFGAHELIGRELGVWFWTVDSQSGRLHLGTVESYNPRKKVHVVRFPDEVLPVDLLAEDAVHWNPSEVADGFAAGAVITTTGARFKAEPGSEAAAARPAAAARAASRRGGRRGVALPGEEATGQLSAEPSADLGDLARPAASEAPAPQAQQAAAAAAPTAPAAPVREKVKNWAQGAVHPNAHPAVDAAQQQPPQPPQAPSAADAAGPEAAAQPAVAAPAEQKPTAADAAHAETRGVHAPPATAAAVPTPAQAGPAEAATQAVGAGQGASHSAKRQRSQPQPQPPVRQDEQQDGGQERPEPLAPGSEGSAAQAKRRRLSRPGEPVAPAGHGRRGGAKAGAAAAAVQALPTGAQAAPEALAAGAADATSPAAAKKLRQPKGAAAEGQDADPLQDLLRKRAALLECQTRFEHELHSVLQTADKISDLMQHLRAAPVTADQLRALQAPPPDGGLPLPKLVGIHKSWVAARAQQFSARQEEMLAAGTALLHHWKAVVGMAAPKKKPAPPAQRQASGKSLLAAAAVVDELLPSQAQARLPQQQASAAAPKAEPAAAAAQPAAGGAREAGKEGGKAAEQEPFLAFESTGSWQRDAAIQVFMLALNPVLSPLAAAVELEQQLWEDFREGDTPSPAYLRAVRTAFMNIAPEHTEHRPLLPFMLLMGVERPMDVARFTLEELHAAEAKALAMMNPRGADGAPPQAPSAPPQPPAGPPKAPDAAPEAPSAPPQAPSAAAGVKSEPVARDDMEVDA